MSHLEHSTVHSLTRLRRGPVGRFARMALVMIGLVSLHGCATHCGFWNYCDIPKNWPVHDTFTVASNDSKICVSGTARYSCASKGMYQSGARVVEIHFVSEEEDDEFGLITTLTVTGGAGEEFTASCFQYNGREVFGFTEVLFGVEIRDRTGRIVAIDPTHVVTRRDTLFGGC